MSRYFAIQITIKKEAKIFIFCLIFLVFCSGLSIQAMEAKEEKVEVVWNLTQDNSSFIFTLPYDLIKSLSSYILKGKIPSAIALWLLKHQEDKRFEQREVANYVPKPLQDVPIIDLAIDPISNTYFIGGTLGRISTVNPTNEKYANKLLENSENDYWLYYDIQKQQLFSGGANVKIWERDHGAWICQKTLGNSESVVQLAITKNYQLISRSVYGNLKVWHIENENFSLLGGNYCTPFTLDSHHNRLFAPELPPEPLKSNQFLIQKWDLNTLKSTPVISLEDVPRMAVYHELYDMLIVPFLMSNKIDLINIKTNTFIKRINTNSFDCYHLALGLGSNQLIVSQRERLESNLNGSFITIWDLENELCQSKFEVHQDTINTLQFNPETGIGSSSTHYSIKSWKLIDETMKKEIWNSLNSEKLRLFKAAAAVWEAKQRKETEQVLNLDNDVQLHHAFTQLPHEMQQTMEKHIMIVKPKPFIE